MNMYSIAEDSLYVVLFQICHLKVVLLNQYEVSTNTLEPSTCEAHGLTFTKQSMNVRFQIFRVQRLSDVCGGSVMCASAQ